MIKTMEGTQAQDIGVLVDAPSCDTPNHSKINLLRSATQRHLEGLGEDPLVREVHFPVVEGVRPVINNYSRLPGSNKSIRADIAQGGISLLMQNGHPVLNLYRMDPGGLLSRPYSATGFGDLREADPTGHVISAIVSPSGVKVMSGQQEFEDYSNRAAEHFARVLLTFLTRQR